MKVLDGITRYGFTDDPDVMAQWKAASRVPGQPAKVATKAPSDGGVSGAA